MEWYRWWYEDMEHEKREKHIQKFLINDLYTAKNSCYNDFFKNSL